MTKHIEAILDRIELWLARRAFAPEVGVQESYSRPPEPEWKQKIARMNRRVEERMRRA